MSSLLQITDEDVSVKGRDLPPGTYRVQVEEALVEPHTNGTRLMRRYGSIRTPEGATEFQAADGGTFRIGNRKLFARSWIDHSNADAARIGNSEIKREAVATGLARKPGKGETTTLDYPDFPTYADALKGKELLVRVKHREYNGQTQVDVADWQALP